MAIEIRANLKKALGRIEDIEKRLKNLAPVLTGAAASMDTIIQRSFAKSKSPTGKVWRPLAESTVAGRRRRSSKPLVDTGLLRSSVVSRAEATSVVVGISGAAARYGIHHQFGTKRIPDRPFLPVGPGGQPDLTSGPAQAWAKKTARRIERYISTGEVT